MRLSCLYIICLFIHHRSLVLFCKWNMKECDSNCPTTPNALGNSGNTTATALTNSSASIDLRSSMQQSLDASQKYMQHMVSIPVAGETDCLYPFYAGNNGNQNIALLFNALTIYALNHFSL
uniref:Uncharacterized protein n=1 Tax=Glossina austeni TaxID=7395 RepID=A0A1A9VS76_GLOAU